MYLQNIIKTIIKKDKGFTEEKKYGKMVIVINYKDGKYICDDIDNIVNKREENIQHN